MFIIIRPKQHTIKYYEHSQSKSQKLAALQQETITINPNQHQSTIIGKYLIHPLVWILGSYAP